MSHRNTTIGILATLLTLWWGTPNADATPRDKALRSLWGKRVTVLTVSGRIHRGTFALFDHKSLTIRESRSKAITIQLHNVARIEAPAVNLVFRQARPASRVDWKPTKVPATDTKRGTPGAALIGLGVAAMAAGVIGTVFGVMGSKAAKKAAAEDSRELCTTSFWSDSSDDCKPRTFKNLYPGAGYTTLAVVGVLGALAGLAMTVHGANLVYKHSKALKKVRPQVNLDPVNKRYSVSMTVSF